jgi:hypothetical protein
VANRNVMRDVNFTRLYFIISCWLGFQAFEAQVIQQSEAGGCVAKRLLFIN